MFSYYLNLALRSLKRNPVLTVLMVLAISVGIGASMTTLTVMHLLAGDPLPDRSAQLLYPQVNPDPTRTNATTPMDEMDYTSAIDLWSAKRADRQVLVVDSPVKVRGSAAGVPPLMLTMLSTTSDFFPMFEVPFQYGHGWSAGDDTKHTHVVVISSDLNNRFFNGADSVGQTLRVRDSDVRIIGVLAPWRPAPLFYTVAGGRFAHGDTAGFYGRPEDIMMPFSTSLEVNDGNFYQFTCWRLPPNPGHLIDSPCEWVRLWVELDSTDKVNGYRRFLENYAAQQKSLGRFTSSLTRMPDLMSWLSYNGVLPSDVRLQTWLAFAFLAICLFNTVGLLLAKFLRRSGEIGVRRALGAARRHIYAQFLIEAGVIGLAGGVCGLILTTLGVL
ncbi:MAG: ABC transporter permease, partial [Gammaproteobacteria bacterium]